MSKYDTLYDFLARIPPDVKEKTQYRISCYELSIGGSVFHRCAS